MRQRFLPLAAGFALVALAQAGTAQGAAFGCGDLGNPFGPFDYRIVPTDSRRVVEQHHFTARVETLQQGQSSNLGGDIDYTLRAMPNHPRALMSMARLSIKEKKERPSGANYSAECYFDRAIRFVPDDPMPHLIYAIYLQEHGRPAEVKQQLKIAEELRKDPTSYDLDYNLGLLYLDVGDYERARIAAKRAYALGAPFPALKRKLKAAGKWGPDEG